MAILRIVAGKYGGRYIKAPEGLHVRPTAQNIREALFSILAAKTGGAVFADLFAGSGAIGMEALSRGARKVLFAENNRLCRNVIYDNLKSLAVGEREAIILGYDLSRVDAFTRLCACLGRLGESVADIIFADPPYDFGEIADLPRRIVESGICGDDAVLIIEHGKKTVLPPAAGVYLKSRTREYGDSSLSFYSRAEGNKVNEQ